MREDFIALVMPFPGQEETKQADGGRARTLDQQ